MVISEDGQTRSLYAEGHANSMNIDLKKQPTQPKTSKQAVPLTQTNSIKCGGESKTTILINQQSNQPPDSGPASSVASSPFLRASLHDVLSQTESPLDSPRMPPFAPINKEVEVIELGRVPTLTIASTAVQGSAALEQYAQVQTEALP